MTLGIAVTLYTQFSDFLEVKVPGSTHLFPLTVGAGSQVRSRPSDYENQLSRQLMIVRQKNSLPTGRLFFIGAEGGPAPYGTTEKN